MEQPEWYLGGETFETILNEGMFFIKDAGPLHGPVKGFSIRRDETGEITLDTTTVGSQLPSSADHPPGTIFTSHECVEFVGPNGVQAIARGVIPVSHVANISVSDRIGTTRQTSRVHEVEVSCQPDIDGHYLVEWLENLDRSIYFPDNINFRQKVEQQLEFTGSHESISIELVISEHSGGSKCLHMDIHGISLFICTFGTRKGDGESGNGFILYRGVPSDEFRLRIRETLSFCFGRYLVFLGHSIFDPKWQLVKTKSVSAYSIHGRVYNLPTHLPSPLPHPSNLSIDVSRLKNLVQAIFDSYERLDFFISVGDIGMR